MASQNGQDFMPIGDIQLSNAARDDAGSHAAYTGGPQRAQPRGNVVMGEAPTDASDPNTCLL